MRALAVLFVAASALAGDAETYAKNLKNLIDHNWSRLTDPGHWLHAEVYEALCKSPKDTAIVCAAAAKQVTTAPVLEESWEQLVAFMMKTTERCLALSPKDPDALRASADAHLTRARMAVRLDRKPEDEDWKKAVALLVRVHEVRPDKGETLAEAVRILMNEHSDTKRLEAVCEVGRDDFPKIGLFRVPKMRARLDAASEDDALRKLLDDWKPLAETYDDDLLSLYNEAVTVAKRRKVKTKHDWLLHTKRRATRGVMFDLPWYRWVGHDTLHQYERDGTLRTVIEVEQEYGALNRRMVSLSAELLKKQIGGKFTLKPKKRRLNKHFRSCYSFAMGGLDKQGDFVHVNVIFVRTTGKYAVSAARIEIRSRTAKPDPEIELILRTLRPYSLKPGK